MLYTTPHCIQNNTFRLRYEFEFLICNLGHPRKLEFKPNCITRIRTSNKNNNGENSNKKKMPKNRNCSKMWTIPCSRRNTHNRQQKLNEIEIWTKTENWFFFCYRARVIVVALYTTLDVHIPLYDYFFFKGGKSKIFLLALYELIHLNISKSQSENEK